MVAMRFLGEIMPLAYPGDLVKHTVDLERPTWIEFSVRKDCQKQVYQKNLSRHGTQLLVYPYSNGNCNAQNTCLLPCH